MKKNHIKSLLPAAFKAGLITRLEESLEEGLTAGRDLLFPRVCPLCRAVLRPSERYVCHTCQARLPWLARPGQPLCQKCGKPISDPDRALCLDCMRRTHHFISGACTFLYEGDFRESLMRMKFQNHREYIPFYAAAMAAAHRAFLERVRPAVILPVPMHEKKRKERGFDQCLLMAAALSEETGIPYSEGNLIRVRYTKPQKGLNLRERAGNLRGAFEVLRPGELQEPVLVIDDIYTTGTTIDSISLVLQEYGLTRIYYLALCTGRGRELRPIALYRRGRER